jgi:hypothetical protein
VQSGIPMSPFCIRMFMKRNVKSGFSVVPNPSGG